MLTLLYPVGTTPFPRTVLKLHGCKVDVLDWGWLCDSGVVACSIRSGCLANVAFKQISVSAFLRKIKALWSPIGVQNFG